MPGPTELERNWNALLALCAKERELAQAGDHPKLLRLVKNELAQLAADMGFSATKIRTRDFRARKDGGRIVAIDQS